MHYLTHLYLPMHGVPALCVEPTATLKGANLGHRRHFPDLLWCLLGRLRQLGEQVENVGWLELLRQ